jgi:dTDP-4-dehydrorhamnose reductase
MRILVFGATGMLGSSLVPALRAAGHEVVAHGQSSVDLLRADKVLAALAPAHAQVAVNLVGLTNVDACETDPQAAWRLNVRTAENVARACAQHAVHLVHVSTDQVYSGAGPHAEPDALPGNYYAQTKCAGELAVQPAGATVLRTNFVGRSLHPTRRSLTDWLVQSLRQQARIPVFDDVLFSPLCMATLCRMIERLAVLRPAGVFNLGARNGMSKADFAFAFARAFGAPTDSLQRVSLDSAGLKAWRPRDMRMDCRSIEAVLGQPMPDLAGEIELAAKEHRANS